MCPVLKCKNNGLWRGPCREHRNKFAALGMKWCMDPTCDDPLKPMNEFYKRANRVLSESRCMSCMRSCSNEARWRNIDRARARDIERNANNPGRGHGLTAEQYWGMLDAQDGRCAICLREFNRTGGHGDKPHIDHDHTHCPKGKGCSICVRALLCVRCNKLIRDGFDNPDIFRLWTPTRNRPLKLINACIDYLENWHAEMAKRGVRPSLVESRWYRYMGGLNQYEVLSCV